MPLRAARDRSRAELRFAVLDDDDDHDDHDGMLAVACVHVRTCMFARRPRLPAGCLERQVFKLEADRDLRRRHLRAKDRAALPVRPRRRGARFATIDGAELCALHVASHAEVAV